MALNGSQGNVAIDGDTWSNTTPAQAHLTDRQIADVLTYVRKSFGNKACAIEPAAVKTLSGENQFLYFHTHGGLFFHKPEAASLFF
jgi:hypothetical protein